MKHSDIISLLEQRGYTKNADVTQPTLYSSINRKQLFSYTNRLNAGWGRGKIIVAKFDDSEYDVSQYLQKWINLTEKYGDQYLCLETAKEEWKFYDSHGSEITFETLFPSNNHDFDNGEFAQYSTTIRTKPFLLLAGISGTGKSRIVKDMAFQTIITRRYVVRS